jgi:DUF438 domain-containing protein
MQEMLSKQARGEKGEAEFRILQPDGTSCWIWARHFPVFDEAGRFIQTVVLSEDITHFKNTEHTLLSSQEELWSVLVTASKDSSGPGQP